MTLQPMWPGSHSSPLVRCMAPPTPSQQIYGGQHLYGVLVPMTQLPRPAGVAMTTAAEADDVTLRTQYNRQTWSSPDNTAVITRSVSHASETLCFRRDSLLSFVC